MRHDLSARLEDETDVVNWVLTAVLANLFKLGETFIVCESRTLGLHCHNQIRKIELKKYWSKLG